MTACPRLPSLPASTTDQTILAHLKVNMAIYEQIGPGISRATHSNDQIIEYRVGAIDPSTLEIWSSDVLTTLEHWPKPRPMGIIFDLSDHGVGIPYLSLTRGNIYNLAVLRSRESHLAEIMQGSPTFKIFFALILSDSSLGSYMLTKGKVPSTGNTQVQHKVFFSSEGGLHWVIESLRALVRVSGNMWT